MITYETLSEAINDLKSRGYTIDFNLGFNDNNSTAASADKFEITEVYRFEGDTDPDDAAVVYAIASRDGRKGILVNGYGISADAACDEMIRKLTIHHSEARQ
jgi:hypothetical protein